MHVSMAHMSSNQYFLLRNLFVFVLARPSCPQCYNNNDGCSCRIGTMLGVNNFLVHSLCVDGAFHIHCKTFVDSSGYENFKLSNNKE